MGKTEIAAIVTPTPAICSKGSQPVKLDFLPPAAFQVALAKLAPRLLPEGSGQMSTMNWPSFGANDPFPVEDWSKVGGLPAGIVGGLELLEESAFLSSPSSPPSSWSTLTPPPGRIVLKELYTPPLSQESYSPSQERHLVVFSGNSNASKAGAAASGVWDTNLDVTSWDTLAQKSKERAIKCSSVSFGPSMCFRLSDYQVSGDAENSWLSASPDILVHLADFALDQGEFRAARASLMAAAPPITDLSSSVPDSSTSPLDSTTGANLSTAQKQQLLVQQQALRMMQLQGGRGADGKASAQISPAVLHNIMTAAKNGHVDLNNPAMQRFKHLIMLQQQQSQSGATSAQQPPKAAPSSITNSFASEGSGSAVAQNMEHMIQQAVKQQQMNQQQTAYAQSQPSVSSSSVQHPQSGDTNRHPKLWSGNLMWEMPISGQTSTFKISLDGYAFSGNSTSADFQLHQWADELKVASMPQMTLAELQAYARQARTPVILFQPGSTGDQANLTRYQSLITILHSKGSMAVIPFSQPDRGILLFTAPGGSSPKLMGAVCFNAPLPPQARPQQPGPMAQPVPQPQQSQTSNLAAQQLQQLQAAQKALSQQQAAQLQQPSFQSFQQPQQAQKNVFQSQQQQQTNNILQSFGQPQPVSLQPNQAQQFQIDLANPSRSTGQFQNQPMPGNIGVGVGNMGNVNPTAAPAKPNIDARAANMIRNMAQAYNINLPPNFDPNAIPAEKLQGLLRMIKQAEANAKAQQANQQQGQRTIQPSQMMSNLGMGQGQQQGQFGMSGVNFGNMGLQMPGQQAQSLQGGGQGTQGVNPQLYQGLGMGLPGQGYMQQ